MYAQERERAGERSGQKGASFRLWKNTVQLFHFLDNLQSDPISLTQHAPELLLAPGVAKRAIRHSSAWQWERPLCQLWISLLLEVRLPHSLQPFRRGVLTFKAL